MIPVVAAGRLHAVLDLDSRFLDAFDAEDEARRKVTVLEMLIHGSREFLPEAIAADLLEVVHGAGERAGGGAGRHGDAAGADAAGTRTEILDGEVEVIGLLSAHHQLIARAVAARFELGEHLADAAELPPALLAGSPRFIAT